MQMTCAETQYPTVKNPMSRNPVRTPARTDQASTETPALTGAGLKKEPSVNP
jgi:hypothetical protein